MKNMRFTRWLLTALCAVLIPGSASAQSALPNDLEGYIERVRNDWDVVGLAVAVVKDDSLVYAKGFGLRALGEASRVDEHTLFAIGSNTKAITAAAIGILVDEGRMTWDDRVIDHLSEFQLFDPYVTREIRIRDLLSHRSGLGRRGDLNWYATEFDRDEVLRRIRYLEPNSSFRAEFGYQNTMFLAAGEVIEAVAGTTWDAFVRSRILVPLGMTRSNTSTTDLDGADNVAMPHAIIDDEVRSIPYRNLDNIAPAGSINASVREMTYWIRAMLGDGEFNSKRIVSADVVSEVQTPHTLTRVGDDTKKLFPSMHFAAYGLGWGLRDYVGRLMATHTGGIDGMLSQVMLIPEERLGIVVLTNTSPNNAFSAISYRILDHYLGLEQRDWNATFRELSDRDEKAASERRRARTEERVNDTKPSRPAAEYAGTYEDDMYGKVVVVLEDGKLVVRRHRAWVGDVTHWHYDTFEITWRDPVMGKSLMTFTLDADGKVAQVDIEGLATFDRVAEERP